MEPIKELERRSSPVPKPQALFVERDTVWLSSRATKRLYALDRGTGAIVWDAEVPDNQTPWGVTRAGGDLFVVCGTDKDDVDDRVIRRFRGGRELDSQFCWPCPERMGSHLSHNGTSLVLSQWYTRRLFAFDDAGRIQRRWDAPRGIVGHCYVDGWFYLATTDAEATNEYFLTRLDPLTGKSVDLARIGFPGRALAFDGRDFWTNHREQNEIVRFSAPR